jgi:hypothetical protein
MAFGQANGYPATRSQIEQLTELILAAGHTDFRDARGPLGLSQRQAAGKFSRDEADALIEQLQAEADETDVARSGVRSTSALSRIPTETLAAELQERGWIVVAP